MCVCTIYQFYFQETPSHQCHYVRKVIGKSLNYKEEIVARF